MLPLIISYNYEIVYHRQKERESLKSTFPCCFGRFFSFLHFLMAYFSTKFEISFPKELMKCMTEMCCSPTSASQDYRTCYAKMFHTFLASLHYH